MAKKLLNRRDFLRLAGLAAAGTIVTACATPTPEIVEKEVTREVEKVVKETVQVEKEVTVEVTREVEKVVTKVVKEMVKETEMVMVKNPETVDSDRLLILPARSRMGVGVWGAVTASEWNFDAESYYMVIMPLIFLGPKGNSVPTPWLAESIKVSEDGKVMDIYLNREAMWSDGTPVTTEDVSWTLHLNYHPDADWWLGDAKAIIPAIKGGMAYFDGDAEEVSGITVLDDWHMQIEFEDAFGDSWRSLGLISPLPKHHLSQYSVKDLWAGNFPDAWVPEVYNGPYRYVKFDEEAKYLELERNEDWWGNNIYGKPGIKRFAEQAGLGLAQFLEGQCDVIKIGAADLETVQDLPGVKIVPRTMMMSGYGLNRMEDRKLSTTMMDAIAYAIDRQAWAEALYFGYGQPEDSIFGLRGHQKTSFCPDCDPTLVVPREYDPDKAKELIAKAEAAGEWDPNRVLTILGGGNDAVLLQQQLEAVGIQSEIVTGSELIEEATSKGDFDIRTDGGWIVNTLRNCDYWTGNCETDLWPVRYHWCNEEFINLCKEARGISDPVKWTSTVEQIMKVYFEDGPIWAVTQIAEFYIMTEDLGGFIPEESYNYLGTCGDKGVLSWYWEK